MNNRQNVVTFAVSFLVMAVALAAIVVVITNAFEIRNSSAALTFYMLPVWLVLLLLPVFLLKKLGRHRQHISNERTDESSEFRAKELLKEERKVNT